MDTVRCRAITSELTYLYKMFPHVAKRLEAHWKDPQTRNYLKNLLIKDRDERQGFDIDTYKTIFHLYLIHVEDVDEIDIPLIVDRPNVLFS